MLERVIPAPRRFPLAAAGVAAGLVALGWILGLTPPEQGRVLGLAMLGGYGAGLLAVAHRALRWRDERKGWALLGLAMVCAATTAHLLMLEGDHLSAIGIGRLAQVLLLTLTAGLLMIQGILAWPFHRLPHPGTGRSTLNLLGGLFMGTSLWLLFWMGGTWHDRFQGRSAHHIHLLLLGFLVAVAGGMSAYLFLECPRRAKGPVGVILVGLTLLTTLLGVVSIGFDSPGHHPGFAALPGIPLVIGLAALRESPAELCMRTPWPAIDLPEILPFLPFLILGPVVVLALWLEQDPLLWPVTSLLAITGILIARQIMLLREIKRTNQGLESRVEERTQALVDLQARQLRQERMNTLALLGAGMIHDMNNAMGVVQASVELARMEAGQAPPALGNHLERITRATDQLAGLSQRIMAFARREIEKPHLVDLAEEMRQVEPLLHLLVPRSVRLSVEVLQRPPKVLASRGLLEQVLVNLVANARDAMPDGGDLRLSLGVPEDDPAAVITVSDTGRGIPPEVREKLFTPFFTTKPAGRGTGLGLASAKALLEEVGGAIHLDAGAGRGTTFRLAFPLPSRAVADDPCR